MQPLSIVVFGLSITSSWGNGHATTYRSLLKALSDRGHHITFFEREVPWYANARDMPAPPFCQTSLYRVLDEVNLERAVADADLVIIGSYVRDAHQLSERLAGNVPCLAFYDIDTPVTLSKLERADHEYLHPDMIPHFDLYLSFSGGRSLQRLEEEYQARRARALYCSVDPALYFPVAASAQFDLAYLGTYSDDRQPTVEQLLLRPAVRMPAGRFCVAGAQYPQADWPANVEHIEHIPPARHRAFYNAQRFALNVTRRDMIAAGHSPSVRLFEAGACATPVISDSWTGLDELFIPGEEILIAETPDDVVRYLQWPEQERCEVGQRMHRRVMAAHTAWHRARQLEAYWQEATGAGRRLPDTAAHRAQSTQTML